VKKLTSARQSSARPPTEAASVEETWARLISSGRLSSSLNSKVTICPLSTASVTKALPKLKVVINHLGNPPVPNKGWEPWATYIKRASELPNMSIKLSAGLALVIKWKWSTDEIRRYSDYVLELFGHDRVLAGSNWPVVDLGGTFDEVWHGITELVAHLTQRTYGL